MEEDLYENQLEDEEELEENKKTKEKNNKHKNKTKKIKKVKTKRKTSKSKNKRKPKKEVVYKEKGHPFFIFFLILIILTLLGVIGFLVYENYYKEETNENNEQIQNNEVIEKKQIETKLTDEEALSLGNELYNDAYNLYNGKDNFILNTEDNIECDENQTCTLISNYDDVINIFTKNGQKDFERNAKMVRKMDDKFYYLTDYELEDNNYVETKFEVSKISENKIVFKAISDYCKTDDCEEKESETKRFVIIKDNKWFIDEFVNPIKK